MELNRLGQVLYFQPENTESVGVKTIRWHKELQGGLGI